MCARKITLTSNVDLMAKRSEYTDTWGKAAGIKTGKILAQRSIFSMKFFLRLVDRFIGVFQSPQIMKKIRRE